LLLDFLMKNNMLGDYKGHEIITYLGKTGSGKTLIQTIDVLDRILNGEETWSSYWLNLDLPNIHYFEADDWDTIKKIRNSIILFDEVADSFDNRGWENEDSEIRKFFRYHRKRHNDIYCNTQDISLVAKTIGILVHKWYLLEKVPSNIFDELLWKWFKIGSIKATKYTLTRERLLKLANGQELGQWDFESENEEFDSLFEEDEKGKVKIDHENIPIREIIRPDLNDKKIEIIHWYCQKCGQRQGEIIKKADTENIAQYDKKKKIWLPKNEIFCPKHKEQKLELRESGIYDTDYELPVKKQEIYLKAFIKKPIDKLVEFKGNLNEEQRKEFDKRKAYYQKKFEN